MYRIISLLRSSFWGQLLVGTNRNAPSSDSRTLRRQVPLIISLTLLGLIGTLYAVSSSILLTGVTRSEQQDVCNTTKGALAIFHKNLTLLDDRFSDWAAWDETYAFMQGNNPNFIAANISDAVLAGLKVDLLLLLDSTGQVRFGTGFDLDHNRRSPIPAGLMGHLTRPHAVAGRSSTTNPLLDHPTPASSFSGLLILPEGVMLVASRPILKNDGIGPASGVLIAGRFLRDHDIAELGQMAGVPLTVKPVNQQNLAEFRTRLKKQQQQQLLPSTQSFTNTSGNLAIGNLAITGRDQPIVIQPINSETIGGSTILTDIYGNPALLLQAETPRFIYQEGRRSLQYLIGSLLILGLFYVVVTNWLLRKLLRYLDERDRIQQTLYQEKELAQVTLRSIGDGIITTDRSSAIVALNLAAEKLVGWQTAEVKGKPLQAVVQIIDEVTSAPVDDLVAKALREGQRVESLNRNLLVARNGDRVAIDISVSPIHAYNSQNIGAVMVFRDVTLERTMSRQLSWQANYDSLTGLVNRWEFENRLEQALAGAKAQRQHHTLCFLDLDRFKLVNDTIGHIAGDELLRQVSVILQQHLRKTDTIARFGGDEFTVVLYHCQQPEALTITQNLLKHLQEFRFVWEDKVFNVGASAGLVAITADSLNITDILRAADAACYAAKDAGRNRIYVYQPDDQTLTQQHGEMQWVARIDAALKENRFRLYYQAIAPLPATKEPLSPAVCPIPNVPFHQHYEVLLRLQDETGKLISPMAFMPAAERYNLMPQIDRWVISTLFASQATQYQNLWRHCQTYGGHCLFTINLSGDSLNDEQFTKFLYEQFRLHQVPPQVICFEITETVAVGNLQQTAQLIREFKALGCHFALDDFGSGMSSFGYLKNLPVDYLKIDGEFVKDIVENPTADAFVEAINRIGHVMGMQTIAEFVANKAILDKISAIGVDYAQGYYIAEPRPLEPTAESLDVSRLVT